MGVLVGFSVRVAVGVLDGMGVSVGTEVGVPVSVGVGVSVGMGVGEAAAIVSAALVAATCSLFGPQEASNSTRINNTVNLIGVFIPQSPRKTSCRNWMSRHASPSPHP